MSSLIEDGLLNDTLSAGTDGSGVYKSMDGGATWEAANAGLPSTLISVGALAIDSSTPGTLYAGTEGPTSGAPDGVRGVFKSTDAGATWEAASTRLMTYSVHALAIDPATPSTLYAGTGDCDRRSCGGGFVFKSMDGGATWEAANTGYVNALAIDPATPSILYAGTWGGGIFKSTDGGGTWAAVNQGLPADVFGFTYVLALGIDPDTPSILYAGTYDGGIFKSTDAGGTWEAANAGLPDTYVRALAIDPTMPSTLYAGTFSGVFKSTDAGATWEALNAGLTYPSVYALAIDPSTPSTLYAGTWGSGVFSLQQVGSCAGDCNDSRAVRINELVTLVNIDLGSGLASACPHGVPGGAAVDIALIIQAVNNALGGCQFMAQ